MEREERLEMIRALLGESSTCEILEDIVSVLQEDGNTEAVIEIAEIGNCVDAIQQRCNGIEY